MIALVYNIHQQPLTVIKSVAGIHLPSSWINDRCVGAGNLLQMRVEPYMGVPPKSMVYFWRKMPWKQKNGWFGGKKWVALFQGNLHFWRCAIPCPGSAFCAEKQPCFSAPGPPKVRLLDVPPISDPHFCMITEWMDADLGNVIRSKQELTEAWGIWGISSRKMLEWVEI